jgi:hypothetical protein
MDKFDLSRKMKRLTAWLDTQNQPDGLAGRRFHGVPFADAYLTIDPKRQSPYASANRNRAYLCGTEPGMGSDGVARLIDFFSGHGIGHFFVWLSPGPGIDSARGLLDQAGLSRVHWTRYLTLCRERHAPAPFDTDLDIRQVGPDDVTASREALGETLWPEFAASAGKDGFFHYMAFDGSRPVAIAALCMFEDIGYLMAAATVESDRMRGAQQALIAARAAQAERLGCAVLVSETLSMLEHSHRNLRRAGFEEIYDKEVYEWNA